MSTYELHTYELDTLFMAYCFRRIAHSDTEEFRYVTGLSDGERHTLLCLLGVKYSMASAVGVHVDPLSNARQLNLLERHGHTLLATLHVHPGTGPESVQPSRVDYATHRRFESAGYRLIGLIFSRDRYLRVFSWRQDFRVVTYGKGMQRHGDTLFRLVAVDRDSNGSSSRT